MSHFSNVRTMVNLQDEYDYDGMVKMIQDTDEFTLADEIAKVIILLWNGYSVHEKRRIKEALLRYATDETIEDTIESEEEDGEDN